MEPTHHDSNTAGEFTPDAETLADAESLDSKEQTLNDSSHPVQTRSGAIAGAMAGAAVGTVVGGPIGTAIGATIGLLTGAAAGRIAGEMFDPSGEVEYWRTHHGQQGVIDPDLPYAEYESAYRAGYNNYVPGETFEQAEADVRRYYQQNGGHHLLEWELARPAAKAAWERMSLIFPPEKLNRL